VIESARQVRHKLTIADLEALQNDVVSLPALALQTLVRSSALRGTPALTEFLRWDGELARESPDAALYEVWLRQICRALAKRFSEKHPERYERLKPDALIALLANPDKSLFGEDSSRCSRHAAGRCHSGRAQGTRATSRPRPFRSGPGATSTRSTSVTPWISNRGERAVRPRAAVQAGR